jgi:hypothetical protein
MDRQLANKTIQNIKDRIFAKKIDPELAQIRTIFLVMQEFKMSWSEIQEVPIPTFKFLVMLLDKQSGEMNK